MRLVILDCFFFGFFSSPLLAAPGPHYEKTAEPTAQQIAAAIEAYGERGATYELIPLPGEKRSRHVFTMPVDTTDGHLENLPDLPFCFGLNLDNAKVTDAGMSYLKRLKNLEELES